MKNYVLGLGVVGAFVFAAACSLSTNGTCEETSTCPETNGGDGGDDVRDASQEDSSVPPPEGCDVAAEPKNSPKCVVNEFGVFVDATGGNDSNAGTKEAPVKTIGAALGKLNGKPRVYVCEGTYAEHVKLSSAVSIYGGFTCAGFAASEAKPKIAPSDVGYALQIDKVGGAVVIADLAFESLAGTEAAPSSIAAFVNESANVTFKRVSLTAHDGADGKAGATGTTGTADKSLDGESASGTSQGGSSTCTCSTGGTSVGGAGGGPLSDGQNGGANIPENPTGQAFPHTGHGGTGNTGCVYPGGIGLPGADAANASDASATPKTGGLDEDGWAPEAGSAGAAGVPGQGGGGGGGRGGAGGAGACAGCGGTGGKGGGGGGASVAILARSSPLQLQDCALATGTAGGGGNGGGGGEGHPGGGGGGGSGMPAGCGGGDGGKGGNGGAGGGGAGGISAGVLYSGAKPTTPNTTITPGTKGAKGVGGAPGVNDGPEGQSGDMIEVN